MFGTKQVLIANFLKTIKNDDDLLTKTLTWNKLEDYLHIKNNLIND